MKFHVRCGTLHEVIEFEVPAGARLAPYVQDAATDAFRRAAHTRPLRERDLSDLVSIRPGRGRMRYLSAETVIHATGLEQVSAREGTRYGF